jgi:anti-sigma-K factor RskA
MTDRCTHSQDAAAWTLNALEESEAQQFSVHLGDCGICQAAVDELMPAAQVLGMAAPQLAAPDALRDRIMGTVRAEAELLRASGAEADRPIARVKPERRFFGGWRPALVGGIACVLLALGVTAGVLIQGDDGTTPTKTFQAKAEGDMKAVATVDSDRVTLHIDGMEQPPAGRVYQVWLQRDGKVTATDALFSPADGKATVTVDEKLNGADRVMITDERMGGSQVPTGDAYVDAKLS